MKSGIRRKFKLLVLSAASLLMFVVSARAKLPNSGCVAFSPQGSLARVVVHHRRLILRIFPFGPTSQALTANPNVLSQNEWGCKLSFSADGGLIVVTTYTRANGVRSRVWNLKTSKWIATLHPSLPNGYVHDIEAVGFWKTSHDVAFSGATGGIDGHVGVSIQSLSGSPQKQTQDLPPGFLDPESGYYWARSPKSPCQLQARTIDEKPGLRPGVLLPQVQGSCLGAQPMFSKLGAVAGATATGSGGVEVWATRMYPGNPETAWIAKPRKSFLAKWADVSVRTTMSPSGSLMAVDRLVTDWSIADTIQRQQDDLWIYRLAPLSLIAHIPPSGCGRLYTFSIGDASGHPQLVEEWCGQWKVDGIKAQ